MASFLLSPGWRDMGSDTMKRIPEVFAKTLLGRYYDRTLLSSVTNTDIQGEIQQYGQLVHVRQRPTVTLRRWQRGQTLVNDMPESGVSTFQIDKAWYWSFVTDDLDDKQVDLKNYVGEWAEEASKEFAKNQDGEVLAGMPTQVASYNAGVAAGYRSQDINLGAAGNARGLDSDSIVDFIVDAGMVLDESNVPDENRFMVIPVWMAGLIKKSELRDASITGDPQSLLRRGLIGQVDRFNLFTSNLLDGDKTTGTYIPFGVPEATSFATQLTRSKMLDNPNGFGMLHRGLAVYGWKVMRPEALGAAYVNIADSGSV